MKSSYFTELSDAWLPHKSKFIFSDNAWDDNDTHGTIMFAEFEQGANKTEDCKEDCYTKYALQALYRHERNYAVY